MLLKHEEIAKEILPYVLLPDIEQYKEQCRIHAEGIAPNLYASDVSHHKRNNKFYVRTIDEIIGMTKYGKLLEVAYCALFNLDPETSVDFDITAGPDQYDVEFNKHCLVDVTSGHIQDIFGNNDSFKIDLLIREAKYDRTLKRIQDTEDIIIDNETSAFKIKPRYLANTIVFMQKTSDKIFYLGEMSTKRFANKEVFYDSDMYAYYYLMSLKGRKESGKCERIQLF